jgi:CHASE3 domain sensor protein
VCSKTAALIMDIQYVRSTFERKVRAKNVRISLVVLVLVLVLMLVLVFFSNTVNERNLVTESIDRKTQSVSPFHDILYFILDHESLIFLMRVWKEDL